MGSSGFWNVVYKIFLKITYDVIFILDQSLLLLMMTFW